MAAGTQGQLYGVLFGEVDGEGNIASRCAISDAFGMCAVEDGIVGLGVDRVFGTGGQHKSALEG